MEALVQGRTLSSHGSPLPWGDPNAIGAVLAGQMDRYLALRRTSVIFLAG
jgi:hypothetical protein